MPRIARIAFVVAVAACSRKPPPPPPAPVGSADTSVITPPIDAAPAVVYRTDDKPPVATDTSVLGAGKTFMVVSESAPATRAGKDILASGGNAVDAAVATAFALAVSHPTAGNIGGGGFAVVRTGPGKINALDFRETAPAAATETMYLDAKGNPTKDSLVGHRASGVPGSVAGLYELHKKYGKKPWKDVIAPAIALARDGFAIDPFLAKSIKGRKDRLAKFPATAAIWMPNDTALDTGGKAVIPDLAKTLQRIADKGPDGFYKGETADLIVAEMKRGGGLITAQDLAGYKVVWREPLKFTYRDHAIASMPPPSSGGIVLAMTAGMLRKHDVKAWPWHGKEHVHWLAEVWRRSFAARNELLGDPGFVKNMPVEKLMSDDYLDKQVATIKPDKATPSTEVTALLEGNHTTNLCVVDAAGMAVAMTTTLNTAWGSGVTVAGAGFLMNNEMDDFASKPGSPNTFGLVQGAANKIEPGKRMLSSMSPTIVENAKHELVMVVGAAGGPRIITEVWQAISNVVDYGFHAGPAIAAPRVHHQHLPDSLRIEAAAIDADTATALREMGYSLDFGDSPREFGASNAIVRASSGWEGAADPRGGGSAMGD